MKTTRRLSITFITLFIITACAANLLPEWTLIATSDTSGSNSRMFVDSDDNIVQLFYDAEGFVTLSRYNADGEELASVTLEGFRDQPFDEHPASERLGDGLLIYTPNYTSGLSLVKVNKDFSVAWQLENVIPAAVADDLDIRLIDLVTDPSGQRFTVAFAQYYVDGSGGGDLFIMEFSSTGQVINQAQFPLVDYERMTAMNYVADGLMVAAKASSSTTSQVRIFDSELVLSAELQLGEEVNAGGNYVAVLERDPEQSLVLYDSSLTELWRAQVYPSATQRDRFDSIVMTDSNIYVMGSNNGATDKSAQLLVKAFDYDGNLLWAYEPESELSATLLLVGRVLRVNPLAITETNDGHVVVSYSHIKDITGANIEDADNDMIEIDIKESSHYSYRHVFLNQEGTEVNKALEPTYEIHELCPFGSIQPVCTVEKVVPGTRFLIDTAAVADSGFVVLSQQRGYEAAYRVQLSRY